MFYEFNQNNSGGYFVTNENLCHRLFIEADNESEAIAKAEELGCYWDGVALGRDCPCCGDRWYRRPDEVDIERYATEGYGVGVYDGIYKNAEDRWHKRYGRYEIVEEPEWKTKYTIREYAGKIRFKDIAEYAQFLADEYGWTTPDVRIFYSNGRTQEIYSEKPLR